MTELDVITNLPPWILTFVNWFLVSVAELTGKEVFSVQMPVKDGQEA